MSAAVKDRLADYIPVSERLEQFWGENPNGRVLTTIIEHEADNGFILMRAEVYRQQEDTVPAATGHAFENRSEGYVNKTSYLENCETSAVGRALALLGYEIKRGIASKEEMQKVERMTRPAAVPTEKDTLLKGVQDACHLLNDAGDMPKWTPARLQEFIKIQMGAASVDDLGVVEVRELIRLLSLRLDGLNEQRRHEVGVPKCECGIERVRREGTKNGKKWAAWMCANKVKGHDPIWIDLDAEAEKETEEYDPLETPEF